MVFNAYSNREKCMVESWYMKKKILTYDVVFEEALEGGYTVIVPSLPGCISEGDSLKEARKNTSKYF